MLDEAGLTDTKICVSNSLDEHTIKSLIEEGAPIDSFGVGENLITSKNMPVFGGVYKLSAIEKDNKIIPKIKVSENVGKITNPGFKKVLRFYDKDTGKAIADAITTYDEDVNKEKYTIINDKHEFQTKELKNYIVRELQVPIFLNGHLVYDTPTIEQVREYAKEEFDTLYEECKRLYNPHVHHVGLSKQLLDLKKQLLLEAKIKTKENELVLKRGK